MPRSQVARKANTTSQAVLKLPNMNEFSPGVLKLGIRPLLKRLAPYQGDNAALCQELASIGSLASTQGVQQSKRARNVLIGMSECGLFDLYQNILTPLGMSFLNAATDE